MPDDDIIPVGSPPGPNNRWDGGDAESERWVRAFQAGASVPAAPPDDSPPTDEELSEVLDDLAAEADAKGLADKAAEIRATKADPAKRAALMARWGAE